jgi:hypothetical protein
MTFHAAPARFGSCPGRQVAVAGCVDEDPAPNGCTPRLGFHDDGVDLTLVTHTHADAKRVKKHASAGIANKIIRGDFVRCNVIRLSRNSICKRQVRLVKAIHIGDALQQLVSQSVDDLAVLAVHIRVHAAERAQAAGRAGSAQEPLPLDEQC